MKNKGKRNTDKNIVNYTKKQNQFKNKNSNKTPNDGSKVNLTEEEIRLLDDLTFLKNYHKIKRESKNKIRESKFKMLLNAYLTRNDDKPLQEVILTKEEEEICKDTSFIK